ncbi:MAG: hypothetical protein J0H74_36945, partial [Chitinophagaceae bacterium]|nr:hypothetical protein [Chitinophagaceae bacterium]
GWLCTYYVYDELNQLRFVLSPKAVTIAYGNGWNLAADTTTINELCFRYEYDFRRRMNAKKVPGAAWTYMIYDQRDRLVYTQDGNMRARSQWMATLYDALNRPTTTGMISYSGTPSQLQAYVTTVTGSSSTSSLTVSGVGVAALPQTLSLATLYNGDQQAQSEITLDNGFATPDTVDFTAEIVTGNGSGNSFSNTVQVASSPLPTGANFIPLTLTFYDDYSQVTDRQYTAAYNGLLDPGANLHPEPLPAVNEQQGIPTTGQVTATRVRAIEDPTDLTKGQWLTTASFYDDRLRVIQIQSDNYRGGRDTLTSRYNFPGQVIATYLAHADPQAAVSGRTRVKTTQNFDPAGRLLDV